MRSSAALLVGVLLLGSAIAGTGAGRPADDLARAPRVVSDAPTTATPITAASPSPHVGPVSSLHVGPWSDARISSPRVGRASTSSHVGPASTHPYVRTVSTPPDVSSNSSPAASASNVTIRDGTVMYVSIRENGDARWNVSARFVLRDENETAAFRDLAKRYENGDPDVGFAHETFERVAERAAADIDRRMRIRNVTRSARLVENGSVGVLSLSFTWTNFTRVEGDRIALGDAFWTGSETWLPALTDDQRLVIDGPSGYYVSRSNVPHNGTRIEFEGPRKFERGDFSVTYRPRSPPSPTTTKTTRTTVPTTPNDGGLLDFTGSSGLLVVLLLFGLGGGAYAWSQRQSAAEESEDDDADETPPTLPLADDAGRDAAAEESEDDADEDDQPPTELLSDEERVLRLLRDNDGRMKQAQIVTETNWSNAKVSQLLSKMDENDDVDKLRIGRENLITLPDEDVTDFE